MEPLLEDMYDLMGASTLADPVPLEEGRARPVAGPPIGMPQRTCPMAEVEVDPDGNPLS